MHIWRHPLLHTLLWALLLMVVVPPAVSRHVATMLPALEAQLDWMDDHYRTLSLHVAVQAGEPVILWVVQQARSIVVGERVAMPHPLGRAEASTLLAHLWGPACLLWAWLLGHAARHAVHAGQLMAHLALGIGATLLLWCLDVPMVLWAAIWSFHASSMAPGDFSMLLWWGALMDGGGRWALALGLAMAICPPAALLEAPARASPA
jgi:hypothetical protein